MTLRAATARPRRHVPRRVALRGLGSVPEVTVVLGYRPSPGRPQQDLTSWSTQSRPVTGVTNFRCGGDAPGVHLETSSFSTSTRAARTWPACPSTDAATPSWPQSRMLTEGSVGGPQRRLAGLDRDPLPAATDSPTPIASSLTSPPTAPSPLEDPAPMGQASGTGRPEARGRWSLRPNAGGLRR
jgi:hypothetical protein